MHGSMASIWIPMNSFGWPGFNFGYMRIYILQYDICICNCHNLEIKVRNHYVQNILWRSIYEMKFI